MSRAPTAFTEDLVLGGDPLRNLTTGLLPVPESPGHEEGADQLLQRPLPGRSALPDTRSAPSTSVFVETPGSAVRASTMCLRAAWTTSPPERKRRRWGGREGGSSSRVEARRFGGWCLGDGGSPARTSRSLSNMPPL